nr:recombinase family protein [Halolactibacillus alkaliphilus]
MIIGYIRVSTQDQNFTLQENAIKTYADNCDEPYEIYKEKESGAKKIGQSYIMRYVLLKKGINLLSINLIDLPVHLSSFLI